MNSRLTIQDLAALLAERTGKDRNSAEQFLREFIVIVSQGVFTDKIAKVKGIGTFKVVLVEKRESIHVNTGERFLIPAHYKFSFLPDKELRELVNKPFSFFDTTELNENVEFSDLDVSAEVEGKEVEDESVEELIGGPLPEEEEEAAGGREEVPMPEEGPEEEEAGQIPPADDPSSDTGYKFEDDGPPVSPWMKGLIAAGIVMVIVAGSLFLYLHRSFFIGPGTPSAVLTGRSLPDQGIAPADTSRAKGAGGTVTVEPPVTAPAATPGTPAATSDVLAKVKIEPGSRLTLISLAYYGSKIFWVYLYDYNKATIKDPNNIPVGTEILVPAPSLYGIDKHSRASIDKAAARQAEILAGDL